MASTELTLQRALYIGNSFGGIFFGVQLILCFQSVYYLKKFHQSRTTFYAAFSLALLVLCAIQLGSNTLFGQFIWIEQGPNTPGGPIIYFFENTTWWVNTFGTSANVATDIMSQCLMLYRCYIILSGNLWIIILPSLLFLAASALAIVSTIESALPNRFILSGVPANFGVPWISISVAFNIVVTGIISLRLIHAHNRMKHITSAGNTLNIQTYTGVTAILVESALPLAVFGIIFAIVYGKNSPTAICFSVIWGAFVSISPQLIILRVAMGVAWSRNTLANATGINFAPAEQTELPDIEHGEIGEEKTLGATNISGSSGTLTRSDV